MSYCQECGHGISQSQLETGEFPCNGICNGTPKIMEAINKQLAAITGSQETDSGVVVEYSNPPYCAICNTNHFKKDGCTDGEAGTYHTGRRKAQRKQRI